VENKILFQAIDVNMKALALNYFETVKNIGITIRQTKKPNDEDNNYEFVAHDRSIFCVRFILDEEEITVVNKWCAVEYQHHDPNCFKNFGLFVSTNMDRWMIKSLREEHPGVI